MFGLVVRKVVLSKLKKLSRDSTLEIDIDGACSILIYRSSDFNSGFRPTSTLEVARRMLPTHNLQWSRQPNVSPSEGGEAIPTLHSQ